VRGILGVGHGLWEILRSSEDHWYQENMTSGGTSIDFVKLQKNLSDAVAKGYITSIEINAEWVSYRHPEYPLNSTGLGAGRFHESGTTAFYLASGDYCGKFEVPNHYDRLPCSIAPQTIYAFDMFRFSEDYGWGDSFLLSQEQGGWEIGQAASSFLTNSHAVSGLLYQSAACNQNGCFGYCMAILPGGENVLPADFFNPR
jgi:hypothetical protein